MSQQTKAKGIPFVLKENYLQVTLQGRPFALDSSHPTFARLKRAIQKKNWKGIPKLVSLAESLMNDTQGNVSVVKGEIFYKGKKVEASITERIIGMIREGKPVKHMLRFMDNLYQNPSETAVREFFGWWQKNGLPITDDGCFLAYKSVRSNYTDTYSGTVSNRPGQVIMMARKAADDDYNSQCSTGFHLCSRHYGIYGDKVMVGKVNPKYLLSAVGGKIRVTQYEVLKELANKYQDILNEDFIQKGIEGIEGQLVIEIKKERHEMIKLLLDSSQVKSLIRRKKITKRTIIKSAYARLKAMVQRFELVPRVEPEDKSYLKKARQAAGLTIGQVAKQAKADYKTIASAEKAENPSQNVVDRHLLAIATLTGSQQKAVTYPKVMNA